MPRIKTSELAGAALDWAVAKCEGYFSTHGESPNYWDSQQGALHFLQMRAADGHGVHWTHSSTDWGEGGPIIEREGIWLRGPNDACKPDGTVVLHIDFWCAHMNHKHTQSGPTPLIAAMRCHVVSKLGDEIAIPEELP
jgi:hypothetical protein